MIVQRDFLVIGKTDDGHYVVRNPHLQHEEEHAGSTEKRVRTEIVSW
jgi:hypothetical protein